MQPIPKLLSKSKLLRGYRCPKSIYLTIHHPELEAPITPQTQALFDQGNQIGAKAREYYPGGVLIDNQPWDFMGALTKTRELIAAGTKIIYEAAFEYQGCYARADILIYSETSARWSIYEVKSSTKVKSEHIDDVGLQAWIMAKSGLPIEKIYLVHLNTECRYPDLSNLFKEVDITADIRERYLTIKPTIRNILNSLQQPEIPTSDIGAHCLAPTECGFVQHCWQAKNIPAMSILNLPGLRDKKWDWYRAGVIQLDDARLTDLNELQIRMIECFKSGERYINSEGIAAAMNGWKFPLIFLDFETTNPAIPRYDGCKPFQHVPFQFSVHCWQTPDSEITHQEFLHVSNSDPRPTLISELLNACGTTGSIVAYYGKFEADRIQELSQYSPEHQDSLKQLIERVVDPLPILREGVYDNAFAGSFSLKKVSPALLGERYRYDDLAVANGNAAQRAYDELISEHTTPEKKASIKSALLEYCKQDTLVMVELAKWLYAQHANINTV